MPLCLGAACAHHKGHSDAKTLGMSEGEYHALAARARGGDTGAAEKLARLWYYYSEDNTKARYWLDIAAQNGSKRAEKIAQLTKPSVEE